MMDYEELVDHADELRNHVAEAGIPYMQVAIHNEPPDHKNEGHPLAITALQFEVLVNSLVATYATSQDTTAISILSYVTNNVISMMNMSADIAMGNRGLTQEEVLEKIDQMNDSLGGTAIPEIFKQAFEEKKDE